MQLRKYTLKLTTKFFRNIIRCLGLSFGTQTHAHHARTRAHTYSTGFGTRSSRNSALDVEMRGAETPTVTDRVTWDTERGENYNHHPFRLCTIARRSALTYRINIGNRHLFPRCSTCVGLCATGNIHNSEGIVGMVGIRFDFHWIRRGKCSTGNCVDLVCLLETLYSSNFHVDSSGYAWSIYSVRVVYVTHAHFKRSIYHTRVLQFQQ